MGERKIVMTVSVCMYVLEHNNTFDLHQVASSFFLSFFSFFLSFLLSSSRGDVAIFGEASIHQIACIKRFSKFGFWDTRAVRPTEDKAGKLIATLRSLSWGGVTASVCMYSGPMKQIALNSAPTHPFSGLFSGPTWVSRYQKRKTSLDFNEARDYGVLGCSGISWTICKQSAPRSRQTTTPAPQRAVFTGRVLFLTPYQPSECHQSPEGNSANIC